MAANTRNCSPRLTLVGQLSAIRSGVQISSRIPVYNPTRSDAKPVSDGLCELRFEVEALLQTINETLETCNQVQIRDHFEKLEKLEKES
jgi:hypothetical protein